MTIEERMEAAVPALQTAIERSKWVQFAYVDEVRRILKAAVPELFTNPPKYWVAPIEPTSEMLKDGAREVSAYDYNYELTETAAENVWRAMVDAALPVDVSLLLPIGDA